MASITIGDSISRVRNQIKGVGQDTFLTDSLIYSVIMKYGRAYIHRQDSQSKIVRMDGLFQPLDFVELEEIDKVLAGCRGIKSNCTFRRSIKKLPEIMEGYNGPIIRSVTSLDFSQEFTRTTASKFEKTANQKTFKYNKTKYYWYSDGYLYFPNIDWDAVMIEALFTEDVSGFNCDTDPCVYIQDTKFFIPDFLFAEIEQNVIKELVMLLQIPEDMDHDNRNLIRN